MSAVRGSRSAAIRASWAGVGDGPQAGGRMAVGLWWPGPAAAGSGARPSVNDCASLVLPPLPPPLLPAAPAAGPVRRAGRFGSRFGVGRLHQQQSSSHRARRHRLVRLHDPRLARKPARARRSDQPRAAAAPAVPSPRRPRRLPPSPPGRAQGRAARTRTGPGTTSGDQDALSQPAPQIGPPRPARHLPGCPAGVAAGG